MNKDFIKYLKTLIRFKSVTPESNGAIEYVSGLLQEHGFNVEIKEFGQDYKVKNLYASYGTGSPNICFGGHVDVVPAGDKSLWEYDAFEGVQMGSKIFGRGSVDMKGAIACMLSATFDFIESIKNIKGKVSFLLTSDEEGEAKYGTKEMLKYLESKYEKIDFMIIGEPTCVQEVGDTIKIGRRGSINFTLKIFGKQGHAAYPELAENPLGHMINILHDLKKLNLDNGNEFFQKSEITITSIDTGNTVTNLIPATSMTNFNIRFNDLQNFKKLISIVQQYIEFYTKNYQLTPSLSADVFIQNPVNFIADFKEIIFETLSINAKFSTGGGTSDARFAVKYCEVVEFGLRANEAHKINEYTEINDLQRLYNVYYNSLNKFLK